MALSYPTRPGDIDHLIADDHAVVERQFVHLEAGRGNRRVLVDQISFELAGRRGRSRVRDGRPAVPPGEVPGRGGPAARAYLLCRTPIDAGPVRLR